MLLNFYCFGFTIEINGLKSYGCNYWEQNPLLNAKNTIKSYIQNIQNNVSLMFGRNAVRDDSNRAGDASEAPFTFEILMSIVA